VTDNSGESPAQTVDLGYTYPANPAETLRDALNSAVSESGLPIAVDEVKRVTFDNKEQAKILLQFTNGNICAITFDLKYSQYDFDYSLDGHDNPSFVMALKDAENSDDLKTVLGLVLQYLSPGISNEEAQRLAENQDRTISVDGYSQPLDIGGYQVVTRYTNPNPFTSTEDFDSCYGVNVTAIKQIWGDTNHDAYTELKDKGDYFVLTSGYAPWEDDYENKAVYADFTVKNVWHCDEWVHGDYWTVVEVESADGTGYTLRLETMRMTWDYEFGVGQKYTLYIVTGLYYGASIVYAIQRSEATTPNSRGVPHEMDYSNSDFDYQRHRIEPEGNGTVYDVFFTLVKGSMGEVYAALEGHGVGAEQWPNEPGRNNYEFVGWFDNEEGTGSPYTKDTPIFQDTNLYVKWKYAGSGGVWPRASYGEIEGIEDGASLIVGKELAITAAGYNMKLKAPQDQRFRWKPISWRLSDDKTGSFTVEAPFHANIIPEQAGKQQLYITYSEEIFDGVGWQPTGQTREVLEVMFLGI
jgi:hypothetical protein